MSLKSNLSSCLRSAGQLPGIKSILHYPAIQGTIEHWPGFRALYPKGWELQHPFDREHGTDTSGYVNPDDLPSTAFAARTHPYAGSQPSIIRAALDALPPLESYTFVDLGCGKGRPLLVAAEFPFRDLIGVELSPPLAEDAKKNATIFRQGLPGTVPIRIEVGDAATFPLPDGNLVVFLYNPFPEAVMVRVVAKIEEALATGNRSLFVVSYNPVFGACFDGSRALTRYFAATLPYAEEERGYGPDPEDTVVIWQAGSEAAPRPGADIPIVVTLPGMRAELARTTPQL